MEVDVIRPPMGLWRRAGIDSYSAIHFSYRRKAFTEAFSFASPSHFSDAEIFGEGEYHRFLFYHGRPSFIKLYTTRRLETPLSYHYKVLLF